MEGRAVLRLVFSAVVAGVVFVALFGRLFLQASAVSEEPVKVIVFVKEGSQQRQLARGIVPVSAAVNSESVLESIPDGEIVKERRFSSFDGFTATVSRAEYERLKGNPKLEVYYDSAIEASLSDSAGIVNAQRVWALVHNSTNITGNAETVCVIDTGIDTDHPSLSGRIVGQGCFCSNINLNNANCCPNGQSTDSSAEDDYGHGTFVSGIIASQHSTYRGIAFGANILAVKVLNSSGSGYSSDAVSAIDWCIANASIYNVSVISMSLGGGGYSAWCDNDEAAGAYRRPVDNATVRNITVVAATGNSGSTAEIAAPACIKNVTAVASSTKSDGFSSFGNRNSITDLIAPGSSITSLWIGGGVATADGTSASTPHVSAAMALLRQYLKVSKNMTANSSLLFSALNSTGTAIVNASDGFTLRRVNVFAALNSLDNDPPNITYAAPTLANNSNSSSANIFVNITGSEVLHTAFLEWNNVSHAVNYSMVQNGSALAWARNHSSASLGVITYRVWGNDSAGNWGVAGRRTVQVNNTAPRIDAFIPLAMTLNIAEPGNQTFNITFADTENDAVALDWYVNGTIQPGARNTNFTFPGNFSQASQQSNGTYNITAVISDGALTARVNWTLVVNNTNRAPVWAGISNITSAEDNQFSFTVAATDLDNDSIAYFINNTVNFTINSSSGNITFNTSGAANFSGIFYLAVNASDGLANASETIFVNITAVNDTPTLFRLGNFTVNETDFVNFTAVADDAEGDSLNFTVNDTARFNFSNKNQSAANFSWKTSISDSGTFHFRVNVTDFGTSSAGFFNVTVVDRTDFDSDGVPDIYDSDDDNDGVPDGQDSILGNFSSLNSSTLPFSAINVTINGSSNMSRLLSDALFVNVTNGSRALAGFYWNFSLSNLTLNFTVDVQEASASVGSILVRGLVLQQGQTKNITLDRISSSNRICLKNADVASLSSVSSGCGSANETLLSCPGVAGGYNCSIVSESRFYRITNVSFTAAREEAVVSSSSSNSPAAGSSSSGGGGGGGGTAVNSSRVKASRFFTLLREGETAVMRINLSGMAFTNVSFIAAYRLSSVNIDVELLDASAVSEGLSLPYMVQSSVYQYIMVRTRLAFLDISWAGVEFRVPKQWLLDGGFKPKDVSLFRYSASSWDSMPVLLFSEDNSFYYYSAELPAFSLFAIAAEKGQGEDASETESAMPAVKIPMEAPVADVSSQGSVSQPGQQAAKQPPFIRSAAAAVILAVLLALFAAFAAFMKIWWRLRQEERIKDFISRKGRK
ncbi:S8 family serine peptidase [Candidatus Woesearchaeota archaeon]|nr:S8 family serine peptidase [Candidatus Woesearchaeota archaeon]